MANEKRLIDADALIDTIDNTNWYSVKDGKLTLGAVLFTGLYMATDINHAIETAPTVDAVEVVHGRWVYNTDDFTPAYRCSACGYNKPMIAGERVSQGAMNYCPNCGAKMDGDGNG